MEFFNIFVALCLIVTALCFHDSFIFRRSKECNGQIRCVENVPSFTAIGSLINCARLCKSLRNCTGFNYLVNTSTCQLFDIFPLKIAHQPNCSNYQPFSIPSVNLALYGPTNQSSTYINYGKVLSSGLAVDGLLSTNLNDGQCSHTNDPDRGENWFMVDLLRLVKVCCVRILTRENAQKHSIRYKDLIIGLTNNSWLVKRPVRNTYPLCGIYQGPLVMASWIQINCSINSTPPARYVIVQQTTVGPNGGYLSLCEIEVY